MSVDQAVRFAHIRPLPRCHTCNAAATDAVYTGRNDLVGVYCKRHAQAALRRFKGER
jgi:hypothetical protein